MRGSKHYGNLESCWASLHILHKGKLVKEKGKMGKEEKVIWKKLMTFAMDKQEDIDLLHAKECVTTDDELSVDKNYTFFLTVSEKHWFSYILVFF